MLERKVAKIDSPQAQPGTERLPEVKLSAVRLPRDKNKPVPSVAAK